MSKFKRFTILSFTLFVCFSTLECVSAQETAPPAKNAVLFIGDGMGIAQVTAARIFEGNARDGKLTLDTMEYTALVRTHAADRLVTDSAAAGTALASGVKTNNSVVGQLPNGQSVATVLELAKAAGKSVGVVSTTSITHATPACFYAHVPQRNMEVEIATQLVDSADVDVILGGGRLFFLPKEMNDPESPRSAGARDDGRDLIAEMAAKGYRVVFGRDDFAEAAADLEQAPGVSKIMGLFSPGMMAFDAQRGSDKWGEPSIAEMTELAIKILSKNPNGFFLMVEGGRIDHAGHGNQAHLAVTDLIAMDKAVKVAKDLTNAENNTLIVVTADHETGGLSINGYPSIEISGDKLFTESGTNVPSILTFATGPGGNEGVNEDTDRADPNYRQISAVGSPSANHTGVDVGAWASGPGAEVFRGTIENSDVGLRVMEALGLK